MGYRGVSGAPYDVICVGGIVADILAPPLPRLPDPGALILVEEIPAQAGGCAANTAKIIVTGWSSTALPNTTGITSWSSIWRMM